MTFDKDERSKILKHHPALAARLFQYKQECIWDCILHGRSQPIGQITDYWRRIEVCLQLK